MPWRQVYDPLGSVLLSTLVAALPIVLLLGGLAVLRLRAHVAALLGLAAALAAAVIAFGMPAGLAGRTALLGAAYGLFPIGWIIVNVIFLYDLTCETGAFKIMQDSLTGVTADRRLQLLLIAFSFGAFFEGAAGFGTPVAVTAAILIGLGFAPLAASGLSLIANTAPVAFGALGTPIVALAGVTGLDIRQLSAMVGRQLPFFSLIIPFWLVWAYCGFKKMKEVWPALAVAGVSFAVPQFLISNFHGPWLAGVGCGGRLHGRAGALPPEMEAQDRPGRRGVDRRGGGSRSAAPSPGRRSSARLAAVDRAQRLRLPLGQSRRSRPSSTACPSSGSRSRAWTGSSTASRPSWPRRRRKRPSSLSTGCRSPGRASSPRRSSRAC